MTALPEPGVGTRSSNQATPGEDGPTGNAGLPSGSGSALIHPLTGEVLDGEDVRRLITVVQSTDAVINAYYTAIREKRELNDRLKRFLADQGAYELPAPRHRTPTQDKISRCPRCSDVLEVE